MATRRLLLSLMVLSSFALADCASQLADVDGWQDFQVNVPLPAVVVRVDAAEIARHCVQTKTFLLGCAVRDEEHGVCIVYVEAKPLPSTIPHELLHCAGFRHGA